MHTNNYGVEYKTKPVLYEEKVKPYTFSITPKQHQKIAIEAIKRKMTISAVLREIIFKWVSEHNEREG